MSINYRIASKEDFPFLSTLRLKIFYEFPYIYEGSLEYELQYLETYLSSSNARIFLVSDDDAIVGATSCLPLLDEGDDLKNPIIQAGYRIQEILYFGESVLLGQYRGRGIGVTFFDLRESYALELGLRYCLFCSVVRPPDHPLKPSHYEPLDSFWEKRGYSKIPNCFTYFDWKDRGEEHSTKKALQFWIKKIS